jgi:fibronectin-binding autotransporter adhesin
MGLAKFSVVGNLDTVRAARVGFFETHRHHLWIAAALAIAPALSAARGATITWQGLGTDDNWMTSQNWNAAPATADNLVFAGSTQLSNDNNFAAASTFPTIAFASGAGAFVLGGNGVTLNASSATSIINNSTSDETINIPLTLAGSRTVDAAAGPISIAGGVAGTSGMDVGVSPALTTPGPTANSVVVLNSAATYSTTSSSTADTGVFSGTLQIGAGGSLPTSTTNATGWVALGNSTSNSSGVLVLGDGSTPVNQVVTKLTNLGTGTGNAVYGGNSSTSTLSINYVVTTGTDSYSGALGGSGTNENQLALIKLGIGTVALGGTNNTYTGSTTVSAGTLVNNGDIAFSAVTVDSTAVLAGNSASGTTGTFGGGVSDGGIVAPGSTGATTGLVGTMNFADGLSFTGSSAAYDCDIKNAGSASDLLAVTGDLDLGTGTTLNLNTIDTASDSAYTIATYTGTLSGTFASISGMPAGYAIDYGTGSDSSITLAVPEPASLSALIAVGAALSIRRRRQLA